MGPERFRDMTRRSDRRISFIHRAAVMQRRLDNSNTTHYERRLRVNICSSAFKGMKLCFKVFVVAMLRHGSWTFTIYDSAALLLSLSHSLFPLKTFVLPFRDSAHY
jgi:hypothetical protein